MIKTRRLSGKSQENSKGWLETLCWERIRRIRGSITGNYSSCQLLNVPSFSCSIITTPPWSTKMTDSWRFSNRLPHTKTMSLMWTCTRRSKSSSPSTRAPWTPLNVNQEWQQVQTSEQANQVHCVNKTIAKYSRLITTLPPNNSNNIGSTSKTCETPIT